MTAVLSRVNDCLYCGDMLVSLVHGGGKHEAASQILSRKEEEIAHPILRERLEWVKAVATPGSQSPADTPFTAEQLPEVIGSLLSMSHINRFSHVVMAGSPLKAPLGFQRIKSAALRMFGAAWFSAPHLISLFALASTSGGIVRPICSTVLRLITSSLHLYGPTRSGIGLPVTQAVIAWNTSRSLPEKK